MGHVVESIGIDTEAQVSDIPSALEAAPILIDAGVFRVNAGCAPVESPTNT